MVLTQWETLCGLFFAFFEKIVVPILTSGGLAAVSSSFFAALCSAFGRYDVVHIHAEGPAFFCWIPKLFGKRVICTIHGLDWAREKWKFGVGSKFIRQGEKSAVKYADEIIVLSKGVQKYFICKRIELCGILGVVAPDAARIITHLFVVSSRQRSVIGRDVITNKCRKTNRCYHYGRYYIFHLLSHSDIIKPS